MDIDNTIIAIATGPGEYGVAILRISGPLTLATLDAFVDRSKKEGEWRARTLYHGHFRDGLGEVIDEIMAVYFPGPHSFTGEACGEIHCHGGRIVQRRILDALMNSGLCLADPGEFTRRAFLNGRIDLSRAEAVVDLIHARCETSRRLAVAQLDGGIFRLVTTLRDRAADLLALVEAYVDFPEEEIDSLHEKQLATSATFLLHEFNRLIASYEQGRIVRDGASLLILGRPNVGKSSLMNLLVGEERSIVSSFPGTTRDTIEESIVLSGLPFRIIDSAGIRDSDDFVETLGVQRAFAKLDSADLVLLVYDAAAGFTPADEEILRRCANVPILLIANKIDLPCLPATPPHGFPQLAVSCRDKSGIDLLPDKIQEILAPDLASEMAEGALICDLRHKEALLRARDALVSFERLVQDSAPIELAAYELRAVLISLGEITGETTTDDILDRIFSRFCIGK
jgi:tRNA modification GTPase